MGRKDVGEAGSGWVTELEGSPMGNGMLLDSCKEVKIWFVFLGIFLYPLGAMIAGNSG